MNVKEMRELVSAQCANYVHGRCLGDHICFVLEGKACAYFKKVVLHEKV